MGDIGLDVHLKSNHLKIFTFPAFNIAGRI